jgi:hypothetical protein
VTGGHRLLFFFFLFSFSLNSSVLQEQASRPRIFSKNDCCLKKFVVGRNNFTESSKLLRFEKMLDDSTIWLEIGDDYNYTISIKKHDTILVELQLNFYDICAVVTYLSLGACLRIITVRGSRC